MPFWTTQQIRTVLQGESSPIVEPVLNRAKNACYEMALGTEYFITSAEGTKQVAAFGAQIRIPPGQFALLVTQETLVMPLNVLAFISVKATKKISGLINVSGFHVDPGFRGQLKFSVYNAGSDAIVLQVGECLFPIWFYELQENNVDEYWGRHRGQVGISSEDATRLQGTLASPSALRKELDELRATVTNWKVITSGTLFTAVATALAAGVAAFLRWSG